MLLRRLMLLSATTVGVLCLSLSVGALKAEAATTTWTGGSSTDWSTGSNWDTGIVPTTADDVVVSGSVTVSTTAPINFRTLLVSNSAAFRLNYPIASGRDLTIDTSAIFTVNVTSTNVLSGTFTAKATTIVVAAYPALSTSGGAKSIKFSANVIDIQTGASIRTSGKGALGGLQGDNSSFTGDHDVSSLSSPGFAGNSTSTGGGGGASAGRGGNGANASTTLSVGVGGFAAQGCDLQALRYSGSGGGVGGSVASHNAGGNGGGVIWLLATNTTTIDGFLEALGDAGDSAVSGGGGGGGGGSIRISGKNIAGTPASITVVGGAGGAGSGFAGGGGSGGCVLVTYQSSSSFTASSITVTGGSGANAGATGFAAVTQIPLSPTTLAATMSTSSAAFTWASGGGNGSFYSVDSSTDGSTYTFVSSTNGTSYTFTGLSPTTNYWFRVASVSSTVGTSSYSVLGPTSTLAVGTPAPTISGVTASSVNLVINPGLNSTTNTYFVVTDNNNVVYAADGTPGSTNVYLHISQWGGTAQGLAPSTTYYFTASAYVLAGSSYILGSGTFSSSTPTTTLLAAPTAPTYTGGQSPSSVGLTWGQNGNPSTTPYVVYSPTSNMYYSVTGTPSASMPARYRLSDWNGTVSGLSAGSLYSFQVVMKNESGSQTVTGTASTMYTLNADGSSVSLGGVGSGAGYTTPTSTGSGWYFGFFPPTPSGTLVSPVSPTSTPVYYPLPTNDNSLLPVYIPLPIFNPTPVSLYQPKNLGSNIAFYNLPTTIAPLKVPTSLRFKYTYTNPSQKRTVKVERTLLSPLGKVLSRSVVVVSVTQNKVLSYNPTQYLSKTLKSGLYTMKVRITSPNGKTLHDENSFDLELAK